MDVVAAILGTVLVCLGAVLAVLILFGFVKRMSRVQRELTRGQMMQAVHEPEREKLLQIANVLGLSVVIGALEPPLLPRDVIRPFSHDKIIERHHHMMQGTRTHFVVKLYELQVTTIPASRKQAISTQRTLCLAIEVAAPRPLFFHIRPRTWVDKTKADGFVLGKNYVWGESLSLLRQCIDWEIGIRCEQFSRLSVQGRGSQITLAWPLDFLPGRKMWPEKEAVLDFVQLGELLAQRFEAVDAS